MRLVRKERLNAKHPRHSASAAFCGVALLVAGIAGGCASSRPAAEPESIESIAVKLLEGKGPSNARLEAIRRLVNNNFGARPEGEQKVPTGLLCYFARSGTAPEATELVQLIMKLPPEHRWTAIFILKHALENPALDEETRQKAQSFIAMNGL